ncbi:bifunctional adenosylcobinamide kinase/adenosylcobinamide-phosphate guanylyltransferase [uncultured Tateyamaria sp.]|uniref:bifunctional adenosylcobinamide kinase/adenosylcobinamide-phosphate guanylyltransferase n=1 Tax=uncultured Tateyamaria sp. TaxID=455651 RepID=UPI0026275E8E|nr:bifunctional adenosylcobinamide kinase/adenosylcobinamide-phosphate guanylyltransferase [uncultured Tateyamaria sp.]
MLPSLTFVLGGAASGKSQIAENIIINSGLTPVYLATARIWDDEIQTKVDAHRARRGPDWITINAETDIATPLAQATPDQAVLLDCATMWLTNTMLDERDLGAAQNTLLTALAACTAPLVVVSNEVGQGIVPDNALTRQFREAQGRLNIALAAQADRVLHVVAGLSRTLKGDPL